MKTIKSSYLLGTLAAVVLLFGVACSKDKGNNNNNVGAYGNCGSGYVYSNQYGCLPQGGCPVNHGVYNNQCVIATTPNSGFNNGYNNVCGVGGTFVNGQCLPGNTFGGGYYNDPYYNNYNPYYYYGQPGYNYYNYGNPWVSGGFGFNGGFGYGW